MRRSHSAARRDDFRAPKPPAGLVHQAHRFTCSRRGWGRALVFAVAACVAWLAWPTEAFAQQQLTPNVNTVADDDTINDTEYLDGIVVSGNTGSESGVFVDVSIGTGTLSTLLSDTQGNWSGTVPPNYITEPSVVLSVTARKTGFTSVTVTRTLTVDRTQPSVSYTPPESLTVGVAIETMVPATDDEDIFSYEISGDSLPPGLSLHGTSGEISGAPTTGTPSTQTSGVLVTDLAGNGTRPQITFPAVDGPRPGVTVSPTALTVPEGGSASYTVRLVTQPTDDVTITVARSPGGDDDLTASPDTRTRGETDVTHRGEGAVILSDTVQFEHSVHSSSSASTGCTRNAWRTGQTIASIDTSPSSPTAPM